MSKLNYVKPTPVVLKEHPDFTEAWLRDRIVEDPSILGLGDLDVLDVERKHPKAGRLDLLMRDPDTGKRYEVEIMLGTVDESHIIRTIEYWDIERKRYPQYDHCAVIVAEEITSRFLNVISLFNGVIPMVAIQLNALQVGEQIALHSTKVLDEVVLGEDEENTVYTPPADRAYWESKGSKQSVAIVDECLGILKEISPKLDLKYNRYYIGLAEEGRPNNFIVFRAKKQFAKAEVLLSDQASWSQKLEGAGLVVLPGEKERERLHFRVSKDDPTKKRELLREVFQAAYDGQQD